jgi:RNA polymerase sigma-70 factor, ECF subfamily
MGKTGMAGSSEDSIPNLLFPLGASSCESVAADAIEEEVTQLFELFQHGVLRYLCSLGLGAHDAEEIAQEVFLALFEHLKKNKSRKNLRGWLFSVAHNLGLKRKLSAPVRLSSSLEDEAPGVHCCQDPAPSPEEQASFLQRQRRLLAVVNALQPQDRYCLYLRAEGLQYREISRALGISLGSVSQSLVRAMQRLMNAER